MSETEDCKVRETEMAEVRMFIARLIAREYLIGGLEHHRMINMLQPIWRIR